MANGPAEMLARWKNCIDNPEFLKSQKEATLFSNKIERETFFCFLEQFFNDRSLNKSEIFWSIHEAYLNTKKINASKLRLVIAHDHIPFCLEQMMEDFPDARYLFLVRDLRASIAGALKLLAYKDFGDVNDHSFNMVFEQWWEGQDFLQKHQSLIGKRIYVAKNEELNEDLETGMAHLSKWLGIEFSPTLMAPTFSGKPWIGLSSYIPRDKSADENKDYYCPEKVRQRWRKELTFSQIIMIESFYRSLLNRFNYPCDTSKSFLWSFYGMIFFFSPRKNQLTRWWNTFPDVLEFEKVSRKLNNSCFSRIWRITPAILKMLAIGIHSIGLRFRIYFFPGDRGDRYF